MTRDSFIESVGQIASELNAQYLADPRCALSQEIKALNRDVGDYQRQPWAAEMRAVEVIVEEVRVVIHEAKRAGIAHPLLKRLVAVCVEAAEHDLITDPYHVAFFVNSHSVPNL